MDSTERTRRLRDALPGTWWIHATNFGMWLSGKRTEPTFTYTLMTGKKLTLLDDVAYRTAGGKQRHILGTDRYDPERDEFVWRGMGVLKVLSSRWRVRHLGPGGELAVIEFSKSLFTPAGIDIITPHPDPPPALRERLTADPTHYELSWDEVTALTWL